VQLSDLDALGQRQAVALLDEHLGVGESDAQPANRLRYQRGERAGERADAQAPALLRRQLADPRGREREAVGDRVGVLEQDGAGGRELQSARLAVQQPRADLALQRRDLLGDRRLRQRECSRRALNEGSCAAARKVSTRRFGARRPRIRCASPGPAGAGSRSVALLELLA
jgi:hypothetical protein